MTTGISGRCYIRLMVYVAAGMSGRCYIRLMVYLAAGISGRCYNWLIVYLTAGISGRCYIWLIVYLTAGISGCQHIWLPRVFGAWPTLIARAPPAGPYMLKLAGMPCVRLATRSSMSYLSFPAAEELM